MVSKSPSEETIGVSGDITRLLSESAAGDSASHAELLSRVYGHLRNIAGTCFKEQRPGHTLQPTALVNEAYIRLFERSNIRFANSIHFFSVAAMAMRQILVNHARDRLRMKRGGRVVVESLEAAESRMELGSDHRRTSDGSHVVDLLDLDEALRRLTLVEARQAHVVELRFFGGMSIRDIAEALGISQATVKREWGSARERLERDLSGNENDED